MKHMSEIQDSPIWTVVVPRGQRLGPYTWASIADWVQNDVIPPGAIIDNGSQQFTLTHIRARLGLTSPETLQPLPEPGSLTEIHPSDAREVVIPATAEAIPLAAEDNYQDDAIPERDQIVVLGRRQAGKTIFLAKVYGQMWRSLNGLTAKALSGQAHKELMEINRQLEQGQWPSSTLANQRLEMEISYRGKKRLLVALDFAGETFSKAFVGEQTDSPAVKGLLRHIDRAAGMILLVDPSIAAGDDLDATVDDDFGMVQAIQRVRNWPGGESVPIVLVLTKMDLHQKLIDRAGGVKEFVRLHFPAMIRVLGQIPIFQVSAVQADKTKDGKLKPRLDSATINAVNPLRFCLAKIDCQSEQLAMQQTKEEQQREAARLEQEEQRQERRHTFICGLVIAGIILGGIGVIFLIFRHHI
jgi:signal recognition particle receptor subunit beta